MCFPGGSLDRGESDHQGAIRELEEETGILLKPQDSVYIGKTPINRFLYLNKGKKCFLSNLIFFSLDGLFQKSESLTSHTTQTDKLPIPNSEVSAAW